MQWRDEAILLHLKAYGEKAFLSTFFCAEKGLVKGFLYKNKTLQRLQIGTQLMLTWTARLDSQMGRVEVEPLPSPYVFLSFEHPKALQQLQNTCHLLRHVLAERHPYPQLFQSLKYFLEALPTPHGFSLEVLFQFELLQTLGYGLDLSQCAATGVTTNLTHVSPRSGRAVCAEAAQPYEQKLLPLPPFLLAYARNQNISGTIPSSQDVTGGLKLTHFFIEKYLVAN